jgi:hypothetical protein
MPDNLQRDFRDAGSVEPGRDMTQFLEIDDSVDQQSTEMGTDFRIENGTVPFRTPTFAEPLTACATRPCIKKSQLCINPHQSVTPEVDATP